LQSVKSFICDGRTTRAYRKRSHLLDLDLDLDLLSPSLLSLELLLSDLPRLVPLRLPLALDLDLEFLRSSLLLLLDRLFAILSSFPLFLLFLFSSV
jgi:hypothetical protein